MQQLSNACCNGQCDSHNIRQHLRYVYPVYALNISRSSSLILYRMFSREVQNSGGDGASSSSAAAEANHFCCSDSCSHPPSADPSHGFKLHLSLDVRVFRWCKELLHTPQTYMSSQQIYTQERMQSLNALITGTRLPMKSAKQSSVLTGVLTNFLHEILATGGFRLYKVRLWPFMNKCRVISS